MGRKKKIGPHVRDYPAFYRWLTMRRRCYDKKFIGYKGYGGRGIEVCDRWRNSFWNFFEDMGNPPSPLHSLDRINNDGDYEPSNCRWATKMEQAANTRTNRFLTAFGKTKILEEWSREFGITSGAIIHRIKNGMSIERALTTPKQTRLTPDQVVEIRKRRTKQNERTLAAEFGVCKHQIHEIAVRRAWVNI